MNIGLDWDDTYTRDPIAWDAIIKLMRQRGHYVYIVTWRDELEAQEILCDPVAHFVDGIFATNRQAKEAFMYKQGIRIDVMIDDNPRAWVVDMEKI